MAHGSSRAELRVGQPPALPAAPHWSSSLRAMMQACTFSFLAKGDQVRTALGSSDEVVRVVTVAVTQPLTLGFIVRQT